MRSLEQIIRDFWAKVDKTESCWNWNGSKTPQGYGRMRAQENKLKQAHRFVWEITFSDIPKELCVCHKCDNPSCVNPEHLFLGTKSENNQDKMDKGRHFTGKGAKKLSENDVLEIYALRESGMTHSAIAIKFGLDRSTIGLILKGQSYPEIFAKKGML